jgi:hypothetical protein
MLLKFPKGFRQRLNMVERNSIVFDLCWSAFEVETTGGVTPWSCEGKADKESAGDCGFVADERAMLMERRWRDRAGWADRAAHGSRKGAGNEIAKEENRRARSPRESSGIRRDPSWQGVEP